MNSGSIELIQPLDGDMMEVAEILYLDDWYPGAFILSAEIYAIPKLGELSKFGKLPPLTHNPTPANLARIVAVNSSASANCASS